MLAMQKVLGGLDVAEVWLVGVSGGRDSVVLLDVLLRAGFSRLVVVHVNHQLRGEASDGDEVFVKDLAEAHGLPCFSERVDVAAAAQSKGLELAAREARHQVFARAVEKFCAQGVFLGHHSEDQAETVLYNLLRGSNGLRGIRFKNTLELGGVRLRLLRPLLEMRRAEIDAYVVEHQLKFREDASNGEGFTARNRIRHEAMPLLREIMQREVVEQINAAAAASLAQQEFLHDAYAYESFLDPQGRLFLPKIAEEKLLVQESVLFRYLREQQVPDVSRELVQRCLLLCDVRKAAKVNLPGGRWLRRKEQRLFVDS